MKVVIDNNLPYNLSSFLRKAGIEATHVIDAKLADADDDVLRKHFADESIIFLTRDNDFWINHPPHWTVIWLALHNPKLGARWKIRARGVPSLQTAA